MKKREFKLSKFDNLPYRFGVGLMILNDKNQVFVGKRIDTKSEAWQMPQGGVDEGEDDEKAAFRELEEETGITKAKIIAKSIDNHKYDLPDNLIPRVWNGRYRGQSQRWFLMRFKGENSEINIETKHPEFCEWAWVDVSELINIIVPFKREIYSKVIAEFESYL